MIQFKDVTKRFPMGNLVLDNISFTIGEGEFVVITGQSGAGKTTLARLMIKDLEPTSGEIVIDGEEIAKIKPKHIHTLRRKVGVIFQDYKIIPDKTVAENIVLTLQIANFAKDKIVNRVSHLLELVGLGDKKELFPAQLSGGELQRAAIARAIAAEPQILFADEPTGNLDPDTALEIINLLKKINSASTTVLVATHNHDFINLANHHLHLKDGKIAEDSKKDNPSKMPPEFEVESEPEVQLKSKKHHKKKKPKD